MANQSLPHPTPTDELFDKLIDLVLEKVSVEEDIQQIEDHLEALKVSTDENAASNTSHPT
jgi:hypothetical protein